MKNKQKQTQQKDKKKRRNILLATLIPLGAAVAATAIAVPIVLTRNKGIHVDYELNFNKEWGGYMPSPSKVTLVKDKTYTVKINFNDDHGSYTFDQIQLGITTDGGSTWAKGFIEDGLVAKIDGSVVDATIQQGGEAIGVLSALNKKSGNLLITFKWSIEDTTGDLAFW